MDEIALEIQGVTKNYPGVTALNDVSIRVRKGDVHAIVGENGAGKSTLIKTIAGAIQPDKGRIIVGSTAYAHLTPHLATKEGIAVIYQEFNLVPQMSCADNLFLNCRAENRVIVNHRKRREDAKKLFNSLGVDIDPDRPVASYSPAYQQIVEICKAVSKDVRILIMDEPTAPLTVTEIDLLFDTVKILKERGVTIIYISHRLEEIFAICDRVTVMRDGQMVTTLDVKDTSRQNLIELMVGRELNDKYPQRDVTLGEEILRAEHVSGNGVEDISFTLHKGEILGIAGLVGSGRSELMSVIYGASKLESGSVYLKNKPVRIRSTSQAIRCGIGLIPEDRKATGLFLDFSILWNTTISIIHRLCKYGCVVDKKKEREITQKYADVMRLKTPTLDQTVVNLSGGNQQKVVIAKALAADTSILIMDEPTRGIDVGAKHEIYTLMNSLVEAGHSILMVSSEMPELLGMSDNILVICEGKQAGYLPKDDFRQELILDLASGEIKH